jgi:hypothetical protein
LVVLRFNRNHWAPSCKWFNTAFSVGAKKRSGLPSYLAMKIVPSHSMTGFKRLRLRPCLFGRASA